MGGMTGMQGMPGGFPALGGTTPGATAGTAGAGVGGVRGAGAGGPPPLDFSALLNQMGGIGLGGQQGMMVRFIYVFLGPIPPSLPPSSPLFLFGIVCVIHPLPPSLLPSLPPSGSSRRAYC